ncbi:prolyl oligopeptidase family serine peptidase [Asanoa sp. NPDC049573]|uniref:S9 family peptidase n=1 Tax=Asanoa sp. NPDC049573 TaxID=3155396 RepID=UPI0034239B58
MTTEPSYSLSDFLSAAHVKEFVPLSDGSGLVFVRDSLETGTAEVFRADVSGGDPVRLTGVFHPELQTSPLAQHRAEPKAQIAVTDGRVYFTSSRYYQAIDNIFSVSLDGGDLRQHTFHDAMIETSPAPSPDGSTLAYFTRTGRGTKVSLLDLRTPAAWPRLLSPGSDNERFPVWSPDGRWIAFERRGDTWLHEIATGVERRLVVDAWSKVTSPVFSPDSGRVLVSASDSGFSQLAVVDLATGELTGLTRLPRQHSGGSWSPDGQSITLTFADGVGLSNQVGVLRADGTGDLVTLTSGTAMRGSPQFSPDGASVYYLEGASNRVHDIWAVSPNGGEPRQITFSMGSLDADRLPVAEEAWYPAEDSLPIRTLVFKPANFDPARKYPVVVALHGHPGCWTHTMNALWQWVISRGVVLVAPNPRGTKGLGAAFHDLHDGDWGGVEFSDVMGVLGLIAELPYVDFHRKATWGGSGGGYMSFLIATRAPQVFDAQVIRAPVSAWKWIAMDRFTGQARYATATRDPQRAREEMGGSYTEIPDRYEERSPLNFVEHVTVPQLLLSARRDGSVPLNESRRWVARMKELGKGDLVDYVEYPDDDHSLLRYRSTMRDQGERIVKFLAEHLDAPQIAEEKVS